MCSTVWGYALGLLPLRDQFRTLQERAVGQMLWRAMPFPPKERIFSHRATSWSTSTGTRGKNMHAPADTVQLILAESECLTQYLTTLPPAAWRIPSACERWEVRDVVAHLTLEAEMYTDMITRSVQGDASPPAGRPWSGPTTAAAFAADTAQRVLARREHRGDHVLAQFLTANAQLNPLLARLGPADWAQPHYTPLGSAPLRHIPADWLVELVVHGWDIRSRLEADAHLSEASVPVVVEVSLGRACRWRFQPGPRLPTPIRYRVVLTGGAPTAYDI